MIIQRGLWGRWRGEYDMGEETAPVVVERSRARGVTAAVIGNTLEFYDFSVYTTFAVVLGTVFFPASDPATSLLLSVSVFGVGFVARPIGALLIGAYADRHGRRPALMLTFALMALGSGLIGFLPTYDQIGLAAPVLLVVARLIQGLSAGGELGASTVFLMEAAPLGRRTTYGSWQLVSQNAGVMLGALVGVVLNRTLPPDALAGWGWRVPFLLGILIAPVGFVLRRALDETLDARQARHSVSAVLRDTFGRQAPRLVLCILLISGATIAQYFFAFAATYATTGLAMPAETGFLAQLVVAIAGGAFALVGGVLADRYGVRRITIVPRLLLALMVYPAMQLVVQNPSSELFIGVLAAVAALNGISSGAGIVLIPRSFPAGTRTTALSIAYAVGVTLFGGTAQVIFAFLLRQTGDPLSPIWYVAGTSLLTAAAAWALRPREDDDRADGPQDVRGHA